MSDEIELLRRFRDETPGPSTDAWNRARTAVAAAAAEQGDPSTPLRQSGQVVPSRDRHPRQLRWRPRALLVSAAVVVLVVLGLSLGQSKNAPSKVPSTTQWRAARILPSGTHVLSLPGRTGSWQLVDYVVSSGWQQNTSGPPPGAITCPVVSACYALGGAYASANAGAPLLSESLYFSSDFGLRWSVLPVPSGFSSTTLLSCPDSLTCSAGGAIGSEPVFLTTIDGGHQWTLRALTVTGGLNHLTCQTPSDCTGLAPSLGAPPAPGQSLPALPAKTLARTTDGGATWTSSDVPSGIWLNQVSCVSTTQCVGVGAITTASSEASRPGVTLRTTDGGQTWSQTVAPPGFRFVSITCPTVSTCWAVGQGAAGSEPFVSEDGGATWTERPFPGSVAEPGTQNIACPSSTECWLAGTEAVPQTLYFGQSVIHDGGSAVILGTTDGGMTWQRVTFTVPRDAPNDDGQSYLSIGAISCPSTTACIALGVSAQGSSTTPVYGYRSNG